MQEYNDKDEITNAVTGIEAGQETKAVDLAMSKDETVYAVLGKVPPKGSTVKLNGLLFDVKFVNNKTGELRLKLVGVALTK